MKNHENNEESMKNQNKSIKISLKINSGGGWEPSWSQDGPKSQKHLEKSIRGPPLATPLGDQNSLKIENYSI